MRINQTTPHSAAHIAAPFITSLTVISIVLSTSVRASINHAFLTRATQLNYSRDSDCHDCFAQDKELDYNLRVMMCQAFT
jgi:hypothetical protein